jgi:CS domain
MMMMKGTWSRTLVRMLLLMSSLLLMAVSAWYGCNGWVLSSPSWSSPRARLLQAQRHRDVHKDRRPTTTTARAPTTQLYGGYGIATNYSWTEGAYEMDVTVRVPATTRARDIHFKATSNSIDVHLIVGNSTVILLDGQRKLRGRVNVEGTYWVISDSEGDDGSNDRLVVVTIEKLLKAPMDDFQVVEYDWKGLYRDEEEDEVSKRHYDAPEALDVKEYAASLGVDVDNINMSMVDKTMFNSGLNLTQKSLDELNRAGYLDTETEITKQSDGSEYIVNDDGDNIPYSQFGKGEADVADVPKTKKQQPEVPFLDTDSPWHQHAKGLGGNSSVFQQTRNFTRAAFAADREKSGASAAAADKAPYKNSGSAIGDPIEDLTVKRMKEILRAQGLKVSGSKRELQYRLRQQVNALMQGRQ